MYEQLPEVRVEGLLLVTVFKLVEASITTSF